LSSDGNSLAVGATREDSSAAGLGGSESDNAAENSGAVYVFSRNSGSWQQQSYLKASNPDAQDAFGRVVSLSADGNSLAVGADNEDGFASGINGNQTDNTVTDSGALYLY